MVTIVVRGHGSVSIVRERADSLVVTGPWRLLPGHRYVVHGVSHATGSQRMQVVSASVRQLCGEDGVTYEVTFARDGES